MDLYPPGLNPIYNRNPQIEDRHTDYVLNILMHNCDQDIISKEESDVCANNFVENIQRKKQKFFLGWLVVLYASVTIKYNLKQRLMDLKLTSKSKILEDSFLKLMDDVLGADRSKVYVWV